MKAFLVALGFFVILGTAGASDCNNITITQTLVQSAIGIALVFLGTLVKGKEKSYD